MGLCISTKDTPCDDKFRISYSGFSMLNIEIATAISERAGELLKQWTYAGIMPNAYKPLTDEQIDEINKYIPENLWLLFNHSDCDGKLTYKEARLIYREIENIEVKSEHFAPFFERLKEMLKRSFKTRQNLYFY